MLRKLIEAKKLMLATLICLTILEGCKKSEAPIATVSKNDDISLSQLKAFLGTTIEIDLKEIKYNENTEQFSVFGVEQINKTDLTKLYLQSYSK
ncbi:hypothetical protein G6M26_10795 [Agrobacterium tumefaciens]|nr:hypothetical protein [Agrobacterium tumefaciens]NTE19008.1 hypothetical protein [Agrobacterium tumefaciens]